MKLLVDAHIFDEPFQGTRTYLKGLYSELLKIDTNNEYYFVANDIDLLKKEFGEYKNSFFIKFFSTNKYFRLAVELPWIIKKYHIDAAHFQYISPFFKTCKEIVTIHDVLFIDYPKYFPYKYRLVKDYLFKRSAKRADLLLTVSDYSKKAIIKHYGLEKKNVIITPNGVSDYFFEESKINIQSEKNEKKHILYVSRIEPRKNHVNLLKAFNELKLWDIGYDLIFVGKRDLYSPHLEEYLEEIPENVKSEVFFKENVPDKDLLKLYRKCSLFVFPSLAEGFGIPPIEAAATGASVLCSKTTAMADFDFFNNRLFDPENLEELKEKITYYLKESSNDDVGKIKEIIHNNYKWKTIASKYLQDLKNYLG